MEFRFRYLGSKGEEIEVASLEQLRGLVQDGTVAELTLLFDALTREWAPARAHAVYRFLRDENKSRAATPLPPPPPPSLTEKPRRRSRSSGSDASEGGSSSEDALGLGLMFTMAEPTAEPDAEETAREIQRAREREDDRPRTQKVESWVQHSAAAPSVAQATAAPTASAPIAAAAPATEEPLPLLFEAPAPHLTEWAVAESRVHAASPLIFLAPRTSWTDRIHAWLDRVGNLVLRSLGAGAIPRLLIAGGLIGLLLVLLATVRRQNPTGVVTAEAASLAPDVSRLVAGLGSAQESGFHNMVSGVDSLRRTYDILVVPPIWLEGKYLADAPGYPEVKDFWLRYQAFLGDVRAHDTTLYRAGFIHSMEEQGIGGTVLTIRLSQAMRDFQKSQPQREEVYRHMDELSSAALQLHALLVDRANDITYEPAIQKGLSRAPVVEAVAEDTLLRDHMWTLLERIFASLEWVGGDLGGSRDSLTDGLLQGIQASSAH